MRLQRIVLAVIIALVVPSAVAQEYTFTHLSAPGAGYEDGSASSARFYDPEGIAIDPAGNLYVSELANDTIRVISPTGEVKTLAGTAGEIGSSDGARSFARFYQPWGLAMDAARNLYVADYHYGRIRRITPDGIVSTVATNVGQPAAVAVDRSGTLYVADYSNNVILTIRNGEVGVLAGLRGDSGTEDGTGSSARFSAPVSLTVDNDGNVYVVEILNNAVRKITPAGVVTTLAGSTNSGSADGVGPAARFTNLRAITISPGGALFVVDGSRIRKVTLDGTVTTVVGYHVIDDAVLKAIVVDTGGTIYGADANGTIRKITAGGQASIVAGSPWPLGLKNGPVADAQFYGPHEIAIGRDGTIYVADTDNHAIRKIANGSVTTFAGNGQSGTSDGTGADARFSSPQGVAVDASGNVFVADTGAETVRKITPAGVVTTLAGSAYNDGSQDGQGAAARFDSPRSIVVDRSGNLFVADTFNYSIRKITAAGLVSTFAGGTPGSADGSGTSAQFRQPEALAIDASGNLYVADTLNDTIRRITPSGQVTTIAGSPLDYGYRDGVGSEARFEGPSAIAVDSAGIIYVSDISLTVRRVTQAGEVTTIGGAAFRRSSVAGTGSFARFGLIDGLAVGADGTLYLSDWWFDGLRAGRPALPDRATAGGAYVGVPLSLSAMPMTATNWQWTITRRPAGSSAELSDASTATPRFTPDVSDLYEFRVVASDGIKSSISTVAVHAEPTGGSRRRAVRRGP